MVHIYEPRDRDIQLCNYIYLILKVCFSHTYKFVNLFWFQPEACAEEFSYHFIELNLIFVKQENVNLHF